MSQEFVRSKRSVPDHLRQRAVFSCDRCKLKKRKCKRVKSDELKYDINVPCVHCQKAGVECSTTIKRKKRSYNEYTDNVAFHYQCLVEIFKNCFPHVDVNNIEGLLELAKDKGIEMPARTDVDELVNLDINPNIKYVKVENKPNTSPFSAAAPVLDHAVSNVQLLLQRMPHETVSEGTQRSILETRDKNDPLYISSSGSSGLFNEICDIAFQWKTLSETAHSDLINDLTNLEKERINSSILNNHGDMVPSLIIPINREEGDLYFNKFWDSVHPYYFVFDRQIFQEKYNQFYQELESLQNGDFSQKIEKLPLSWVCCIYLSWIFGKGFQIGNHDHDVEKCELDDALVSKYLDIIKLSLLDLILTPTTNGLQLLYLYAGYLFCNENKDSAWILYGLAIRQATAMGLHRDSTMSRYTPRDQEARKRIWWGLFKIDVYSSCSYGRIKPICNNEITIGLPKLSSFEDLLFGKYYQQTIILAQKMNEVLYVRSKWYAGNILNSNNLVEIWKYIKSINEIVVNYPIELKDYKSKPYTRYKAKLHIQHNYYYILMSLPVLLKILNSNIKLSEFNPVIHKMLFMGLNASIELSHIMLFLKDKYLFNGSFYFDIFYGYCSTMYLIVSLFFLKNGYQFLNYKDSTKLDHRLLLQAIKRTRGINLDSSQLGGTMKNVSEIIEQLLNNLGIIDYLNNEEVAQASTSASAVHINQQHQDIPSNLSNTFHSPDIPIPVRDIEELNSLIQHNYPSEPRVEQYTNMHPTIAPNLSQGNIGQQTQYRESVPINMSTNQTSVDSTDLISLLFGEGWSELDSLNYGL